MKKLALLLICSLAYTDFSFGQIYEQFTSMTASDNEGNELNYRLHSPESNEGENHPLIIFLHGAGERGNDNLAQLTHVVGRLVSRDIRTKYPSYILAPQCPKGEEWTASVRLGDGAIFWNDAPNAKQKMIYNLANQLVKEGKVDPTRIYIIGLSMGGAGTWDMLKHYPDLFACAVPICGWASIESAEKMKDIPIWAFHGADDVVVSARETQIMIDAIRNIGGHPIYTEFEATGHNSWDPAFTSESLIYDWIFSHSKNE